MWAASPTFTVNSGLSCAGRTRSGSLRKEKAPRLNNLRHITRFVHHGLALQWHEAGVGDLSCHQSAELVTEQVIVDALEYQRGRLDLREKGGHVHGVDVLEDSGHGLAAGGLTEESAAVEVGGGALVADGVGEKLSGRLPVAAV